MHYAITWGGVELMRWGGMFESIQQDDVWAQTEQEKGHITGRPRSVRVRPSLRDPEFVAIVAVVGMVTPLNNRCAGLIFTRSPAATASTTINATTCL